MKRIVRAVGAAALLAVLAAVTSSGALAASGPMTENLDSLGTAESNEGFSSGLSAEVHSAEKDGAESFLSVTWSIRNDSGEDVYFDWPTGDSYLYENIPYSGVTATSTDMATRFHPIMDSSNACLCSGVSSIDFKERIGPGEQVAYWSMFSVPEDVDAINLEIPGFADIEDITIS
ncbi:hypothetical protein [Nocardiopsis prasina]|uniref:hypothetical protein n=1 Tax=Nocardiopsis prasina TaxID=2015 RepID=UPI00034BF2BF|nr:hypothetical protein [Nocardiopsis prasina]